MAHETSASSLLKIAKGISAPNIAPKAEYIKSWIRKLSGTLNPSVARLNPINIAEKPNIPKEASAITCKAKKFGSMTQTPC
jgi:hypothetical protein